MAKREASDRRSPLRAPSLLDPHWKKKLAPQWRKNRLANERQRKEAQRDAK